MDQCKSVLNGVADFNNFLLQKVNQFINKVNNGDLLFNILPADRTFKRQKNSKSQN